MTSLTHLNASGLCGINQKGIQNLRLVKLKINSNYCIEDITHITTLKKLYAKCSKKIGDDGLNGLSLTYLDVSDCHQIKKFTQMTTLTYLNISSVVIK